MIKFYEVILILKNNEECWYRGYDLQSANYCFEKNESFFDKGEIQLREYEFSKMHELDCENEEFMNEYLSGGLKCGYNVLKEK